MMPDREKVIKGLEHCRKTSCESCPYNAADVKSSNPICLINEMLSDALAMLKEQEAKWIHREDMDFIDKYNCNHFHGMCTNCGLVHDFIDGHTGQYLYCPTCGRAVKWE